MNGSHHSQSPGVSLRPYVWGMPNNSKMGGQFPVGACDQTHNEQSEGVPGRALDDTGGRMSCVTTIRGAWLCDRRGVTENACELVGWLVQLQGRT